MKASELKAKKPEELTKLKLELLEERLKLRIQKKTGQLTKTNRFKEIRRDIARINQIQANKG